MIQLTSIVQLENLVLGPLEHDTIIPMASKSFGPKLIYTPRKRSCEKSKIESLCGVKNDRHDGID